MNKLLTVLAVLVVLVAAGVWLWPMLNQPGLNTPIVAFYLPGSDDGEFASEQQARWIAEGITPVSLSGCSSYSTAEQLVSCLRDKVKQRRYQGKQLVVMAGNEFGEMLSVLSVDQELGNQLSAVVFLRGEEQRAADRPVKVPDVKVLTLSLANDSPESVQQSRQFASALRNHGMWSWFTMLVPATVETTDIHQHPTLTELIKFLVDGQRGSEYGLQFHAESMWQEPPLDNQKFLEHGQFAHIYPVDELFFRTLKTYYESEPFFLKQWPLKQYRAIDLMEWRESLPKDQRGRFVSFTNHKGHHFFLDLNRFGRYEPVIVFQVDDETNLYRMARFYRTKQYYSWAPEKGGPSDQDMYVEPLGAFLHFRKPLPKQYELPLLQYTALQYDSVKFINVDPYEGLSGLSFPTYKIVSTNCIPCHSIDGVGGAAYHLDAFTLQPREGFALPLRSYTKPVLQEFFFNQQKVADTVGVRPNFVAPEVARELIEWLSKKQ